MKIILDIINISSHNITCVVLVSHTYIHNIRSNSTLFIKNFLEIIIFGVEVSCIVAFKVESFIHLADTAHYYLICLLKIIIKNTLISQRLVRRFYLQKYLILYSSTIKFLVQLFLTLELVLIHKFVSKILSKYFL